MTLARRVCAVCHRTTGFAPWAWSGKVFVTSHGFCRRCVERVEAVS